MFFWISLRENSKLKLIKFQIYNSVLEVCYLIINILDFSVIIKLK